MITSRMPPCRSPFSMLEDRKLRPALHSGLFSMSYKCHSAWDKKFIVIRLSKWEKKIR